MKRTHEFITKEPFDPVWLAELNEKNKTPELIEYKLSEITGKLSRRKRKSINHLWSQWRKICKHGERFHRCKNCSVKVEKKKEIDKTASYNQQQKQRRAVSKFNGKQNNEDRFKKRKIELASFINYNDTRSSCCLKCNMCLKTKIAVEESNTYTLKPDETFTGSLIKNDQKKIRWFSICVTCAKQQRAQNYLNGGVRFTKGLVHLIRAHKSVSPLDAKLILDELIKSEASKCFTCDIDLIAKGKSGFSQMSINKIHPDKPKSNIVHMSCLACNLAQNDLPYIEFLRFLYTIAKNTRVKNNTEALNEKELQWLNWIAIACPNDVRLFVANKYGRYCYYTGLEIAFESFKFNTASFDRINSKLPYSNDQVQLVCKNINYVKKLSISEAELLKWLAHLRNNKEFIFNRFKQFYFTKE